MRNQNYECEVRLKLKCCNVEETHKALHLGKWSPVQWKITDVTTDFTLIIIFFDGAFEYGDSAKFWGYVEANAEPVCVEFCNFVQCCKLLDLLLLNLMQLFSIGMIAP
jgi:hypothetical protein